MTTPASYACIYDISTQVGYSSGVVYVTDSDPNLPKDWNVTFGACDNIRLSASDYNSLTTAPITTDPVTTSPALFPALSAADGLLMSGAILGVWAIGYACRMAIKALNSDDERN